MKERFVDLPHVRETVPIHPRALATRCEAATTDSRCCSFRATWILGTGSEAFRLCGRHERYAETHRCLYVAGAAS